jgi:polyisoprenyl-teichoic acid--peptidoglycan teichoic acid transferase
MPGIPAPSGRGARRLAPLRLVIALLLITALFGAAYAASSFAIRSSRTVLPGNELRAPGALSSLPGMSPDITTPTSRITILVLGVDRRPGRPDKYKPFAPWGVTTDPGRSDTMALVSIDPATKSASVLSIPRDLWLEEPDGKGGWSMDRINEPYHTGESLKLPGGGGALAAQAVSHNLGIHIDYYVDFDFNGFMKLIDDLGGVDLDVPSTLTATVYPSADTGAYEYTFYPGTQHMNGELALAYSRFRLNADGDFGRIQRQQAVGLAARQKALSLGWIDHPLEVWQEYSAAVDTNIPPYLLPGLALLTKQINPASITTHSLGENDAVREVVIPESGADVLYPIPSVVAKIVADTFRDPSLGVATLARLQKLYPLFGGPSTPVARNEPVIGNQPATGAQPLQTVVTPPFAAQPGSGTPSPYGSSILPPGP